MATKKTHLELFNEAKETLDEKSDLVQRELNESLKEIYRTLVTIKSYGSISQDIAKTILDFANLVHIIQDNVPARTTSTSVSGSGAHTSKEKKKELLDAFVAYIKTTEGFDGKLHLSAIKTFAEKQGVNISGSPETFFKLNHDDRFKKTDKKQGVAVIWNLQEDG